MRQKPSSADEEDVFFIANQKSSSIILLETKTFFKHLKKIRPIAVLEVKIENVIDWEMPEQSMVR